MADATSSMALPDEFAQRGRWRAFRDSSVEAAYRTWHRDQILPVGRGVAIGAAVFWTLVPLSFDLLVGDAPRALYIGTWAVGVPVFLAGLIASFTSLRRWMTGAMVVSLIVLGLDFTWLFSIMYGPFSAAIIIGVLSSIYFPIILRIPTGSTAIAVATLTAVPVGLMAYGTRQGEIAIYDTWLYLSMLVTNGPLVVLVAAVIEAGMRQKFVAEQTIARQQSQLEISQRLLRRYVPEQVADAVMSSTPDTVDRHERRKLSIFFSDLVGFTDLSDEMEPEDLANVLHDYFTEMSAIARRHGGTVDDLIGDAVLVLFGAPDFTDDHDQALRAVRMAAEMQAAMEPLNQRWAAAGIPETLLVRMGINTGVATVGNFGSAERTKYTALGKQVNIAARIQSHCEPGKVLIGHTTWLLVRDETACIPTGELELKGLRKPMPAYEVHD